MNDYLTLKKFIPISVAGLVMICALAVLSGYKVSIDYQHGFRFEPVKTKTVITPNQKK